MASKKKSPSFEIPDAVRQAGQSGWVYRTDGAKAKPPRRSAPAHPVPTPAAVHPPSHDIARAAAAPANEPEPRVTVRPDETPTRWTISSGVIGLGLHVAAVPLVVPLYVTAAISRKLGLLPR
ncbi:MAG: hypothetical protein ACM3NQ_18575 [Bacteroidales bacterium]